MSDDKLIRQEIRSVASAHPKILRVWLLSVPVKATRVPQDGVHIAIELDENELQNDSADNYWATRAEVDFQTHFDVRLEAVCDIQLGERTDAPSLPTPNRLTLAAHEAVFPFERGSLKSGPAV